MARKGENIYKRKDGRWEGRYAKGRRADGKILYGSVYGQKYAEVRDRLMELKTKSAAQLSDLRSGDVQLREWMWAWLETVQVKPSTYACYRGRLERHIIPALGEWRIDRIRSEEIEHFKTELLEAGLCVSTVRGVIRLIDCALQKAVDAKLLYENPCRGIQFSKMPQKRVDVLTRAEQKILEDAALQDKHGLAVLLSLYTGMRIGEICALKWEHVNLQEGYVQVHSTIQRMQVFGEDRKTELWQGPPKSGYSQRRIPLPSVLTEILKQHRDKTRSAYVVTCKGRAAEPRVVCYRFHRILCLAGLKKTNFHSLRHTFATRCMELGVDVTTLSRILGHSSVKMTLDIYTDSLPDQQRYAMKKLDSFWDNIEESESSELGVILTMLGKLIDKTNTRVG